MISLLFVIEIIQLVMRKGNFDIDDFLFNMFGAIIGFEMWKPKFINSTFAD